MKCEVWSGFDLTELELEIGFIDSNLKFKFTGTGLVGLRFVRPAEPKRFIFANRIPSFCPPNGTGINQSKIKLSWMHKLEDGMKMERIAWTESADESWNILQVERKERSQIHMHTTLHKYSQTNNTMFDAFHLHLSISIWIRSSSDHIGFGFGFQIKSKRKFTPIESNRISKGIEKRKRKETKRNPKEDTKANRTAKWKRGREKIGSKRRTRKQREWSREQRQTGRQVRKESLFLTKWIRRKDNKGEGRVEECERGVRWDEGRVRKPTLDYWTARWRWRWVEEQNELW